MERRWTTFYLRYLELDCLFKRKKLRMKVTHLTKLIILLMVCIAIIGCEKDHEETGTIYGIVTDFSTGEPVSSANVQLRPSGETALTGTDGMYEFTEIATGSYSITVSKAEYTDLVDDYVIDVKDGKRMRRDVQIKKRPVALHLYDNESQEISELDFGANEGVTKKNFNIFNGGTKKIDYTIEKSVDWITEISPSGGAIDVGMTKPIVVTIDRRLLASGENTTTLLITSSSDGGKELTVKATNNVELPTVSILDALAIDSVTYRIRCEVVSEGGMEVTERGICWNTFGIPTMDDETIPYSSGGTGQYAIRMENLTMATHYYVRAYAKNELGVGFSEVIDFVTGDIVTPPSVNYIVAISANPANGGAVEGEGSFNQGQQCTVKAIANTGYSFVNWTENGNQVSTYADYSFVVNANRTLVANFSFNGGGGNAPTGAIGGLFSVSATQQVWFSQGNLQYQASTNTWRFAENQWNYIGEDNANMSQTYSGWIDLFGWSTSGYNHGAVCYQPWSTSENDMNYYPYGSNTANLFDQTGQADWGYNAISNGGNTINSWRTLTKEEWNYVFFSRNTASGIRFAKAIVNGINGVVLLPDTWSSSTYPLNATNNIGVGYCNTISTQDWTNTLQPAGAVFLPTSGSRYGTSVYNHGSVGKYWTSSRSSSNNAFRLLFNGTSSNGISISNESLYYGNSIRLVRDAE